MGVAQALLKAQKGPRIAQEGAGRAGTAGCGPDGLRRDRLVSRLDLEWAVDGLPARLRRAARLIYVEGVPRKEVHKRLKISASKFDHGMSAEIDRLKAAGLKDILG